MTSTRKKGFLKTIAERIGLSFSREAMESAYSEFKKDFFTKLGTLINILQIGILIYFSIIDFIILPNTTVTKVTDASALGVLIFLLAIRKKISSFYVYFVVAISNFITIRDGLIIETVVFGIKDSFILGNLHGIILTCSLLTLKQVRIRTFYHITVMIIRVITLQWVFPVIDSLILFLFYVQDDILERKKFQKIYESQENLKNFQSLLSNEFPLGMFILESDLQTPIYTNTTFQNTFRQSPSPELFKKFIVEKDEAREDLHDIFTSLSLSDQSSNLQEVLVQLELNNKKLDNLTSQKLRAYYSQEEDRDKPALHYEIIVTKITWKMKPAFAFIIQDISEKDRLLALKIADEQKDKVIATVSHELRTPINGSLGILTMIQKSIPPAEKAVHELIKNCQSCTQLLLYLVNSILDLTQIRHNRLKVNKTIFEIDDILAELRSLYMFQSIQKNIEFIIKKDTSVPRKLYSDKYRLIQILINLIGNAFKFTFSGSITLEVTRDPNSRNYLMFKVIDTGIGIKPDDKGKLFKMFGKIEHKEKNLNSQGVGLGLTISNELVKILNDGDPEAKISLESIENEGSTFSFAIQVEEDLQQENDSSSLIQSVILEEGLKDSLAQPLPVLKKSEMLRPSPASSLVENRNLRILVVDDNPFNLYVLKNFLVTEQIEVIEALNGKIAIEKIEDFASKNKFFDLIFMDIQMPVLDGIEASRIIKKKIENSEIRNVPIIALTASSSKEIAEYKLKPGDELGICDFLEKPIKDFEINKILSTYLDLPILNSFPTVENR